MPHVIGSTSRAAASDAAPGEPSPYDTWSSRSSRPIASFALATINGDALEALALNGDCIACNAEACSSVRALVPFSCSSAQFADLYSLSIASEAVCYCFKA